ncbi:MAG TPA: DsrE family protein [Thiohalobacter sp.]|nr:DsrE family protein [Thiohalobacter sp.]
MSAARMFPGRRIAVLWLAAIMLAAGGWLLPATSAVAEPKVVYHADFSDPRRFSAMLTSINNMITTYKSDLRDYDVRIVFVAYGIRFLTDDALAGTPFAADAALRERRENLRGRLRSLVDVHGVKLELCNITREETGLSPNALYDGVEMVQSGVVRISELQHQGFAYLKIE